MKRDTVRDALVTGILIFLVVVFLAAALAVLWLVTNITAKIGAAIIGVVSSIIVVFFKYSLDIERQRKRALLLEKQKNYSELLANIGNFVRADPDTKEGISARDRLTAAHLASWAFGDVGVIVATNRFMSTRDGADLRKILEAVRVSLEQSKLPSDFEESYDFGQLFPPQKVITQVPGVETPS